MKKIIMTLLTILIIGCASVGWVDSQIPINVSSKLFNDVASQYMDRPTFANLRTYKGNGSKTLVVQMVSYRLDSYHEIEFVPEHIDEYIANIDKYLQWEKTATKDGDLFTKEIGEVDRFPFDVKFTFHSGNMTSHYLELSHLGGNEQYYDRENAEKLRLFLLSYKNGEIVPSNVNEKYK
jgi:hypothetical protein